MFCNNSASPDQVWVKTTLLCFINSNLLAAPPSQKPDLTEGVSLTVWPTLDNLYNEHLCSPSDLIYT